MGEGDLMRRGVPSEKAVQGHMIALSVAEIEVVLERLAFGGLTDDGLTWKDVSAEGDDEILEGAIAKFERVLGHNGD